MENDKGKLSQSKDSLSMSPSKNQNRVLRPFNGPAKSPISFKQVNPRMRNTLSTSKVNENIEGEYSDDTASFSNSIPNKLANHDYPPFPHHDLKDFVMNNGSLNPSPFKPDHRGFNYSSERNPRRPFESPFMKFCDDLSPLHSRMQTPISNLKNLHVSSEQILKFPFNSPMLLGKLEEPQQNQQYPFKPLPIQKLDFSGFCNSSRPKGNHHHQHHTEQPIEERDESSQHEASEEEVNEHEHASEEHRNSQSMHDEATRGSHMATEEKPIKFNVRFQKSKYTGSNPFQALSGGQASKTLSHHSKHYDEPMGKHSTGKSLKIEESPNSPARKSMRKLYNDTNTFTTETNHTLHYSERSNRCDHSHGTNSHTASVAKRKNDDDPEDNENESDSSAKKKVTCNCKKSKCLKLYCDCFAAGELCGPECNCCSCHNNEDHNDERNTAILSVLDRNPTAFRPKIDKQEPVVKIVNEPRSSLDSKVRHNKGCNCKKSGCLKKYCECYAAGVKCSELCKCETCKNMDPSAIIKKAQSYSQMMYLNSADKRRHYSEEDSNGECESCCSHMHHGDENEEVYDSDPEYRGAYAGRYSSKKTKTSDESINMLGERSSKRSLQNREITPSKPAERGSNHDHYKVEGENTRSNSKKHTSVYRTPFVAVESSKKLNFSQHTPSPSKNHKNQQDRNLRKPPIKPFSSDYHGGGAYAPHPKVKSEY